MPIKPKSFFHPVLSNFSSDYKPGSSFEVELSPRVIDGPKRNQIAVGYEIELNCPSLRDLIIDNRAAVAFDLYCGDTMFRSLHKSSELSGEIILPAGAVKGSLEVQPLIVVTNDQHLFFLEGISDEYNETTFELSVGEPLALAPSIAIPIDFSLASRKETVKIQLSKNVDKNSYEIVLMADQIVVHMGEMAHAAFQIYANDPLQKPNLFTSIYKDCVVEALEKIVKETGDIEYRWKEHFVEQLEKNRIKLPKKDADFAEINRVALSVLGSRGFQKVVEYANK